MYELKLTHDETIAVVEIFDKQGNTNIKYEIISSSSGSTMKIFNDESAELISEYIKEYLVSHGFDGDYNENRIGIICEGLIDKFLSVTGW